MSRSKSVLITGCSSGFGELTAMTLAEGGHEVYASMRDVGGSNAATATTLRDWAAAGDRSLEVVELDVTDDASVRAAVDNVEEKSGGLDVVVNNAGALVTGFAEAFGLDDYRWMMDVNVYGPVRLINAVLPRMRARGDGLLVLVSSVMGRLILPFAAPYTASKWAAEGMFESYRYELNPLGIDTVIIEPGPFPTKMGPNARPAGRMDALMDAYGPTADALRRWTAGFGEMFSGDNVPDPQDVADAVIKSIETPKGEREFRVIVDTLMAVAPRAINETYTHAQAGLLDAIGQAELKELRK
jgi:NAD(P)-dependent dehydrogenase (short-subunit alcohol dehydrogenase family)